jgi:predicted RNA-binding protein
MGVKHRIRADYIVVCTQLLNNNPASERIEEGMVMETLLKGYINLDGQITPFQIVEHRWITELVIPVKGLANFPLIPTVLNFTVGTNVLAVEYTEGGVKKREIFSGYRPALEV